MQSKAQHLQAESIPDVCNTNSDSAPLIDRHEQEDDSSDVSSPEFFESDPRGLVTGISIRALRKVLYRS